MDSKQILDLVVHFIQTFGLEDSTVNQHFVYHRLFNVVDNELSYAANEHPVLNTTKKGAIYQQLMKPIIYHLGYSREVVYLLSVLLTDTLITRADLWQ